MKLSYEASLVRVIDGDTAVFDLTLYGTEMGRKVSKTYYGISVRFLGIDTPERGRKGYYEAKGHTWDRLEEAKSIQIETDDVLDTFSRLLGIVMVDGENLNQELLELGLAFPYVK